MNESAKLLDCAIVGGGPAGLSAAIYLARFRREVAVLDAGNSRASLIPLTRNYPGFPDGISGNDLLRQLRMQAARFGINAIPATVSRLEQGSDGSFMVVYGDQAVHARTVMLTTGLVDIEPDMADVRHAIARGQIRYCPVCDGYETAGKKVALIGYGSRCIREAMFIRHFTEDLTLLTLGQAIKLSTDDRDALSKKNIRLLEEPIAEIVLDGAKIGALRMAGSGAHHFDTIYSMLGTKVRSDLAVTLGARADEEGNLLVDDHLQTSVPGLYAAGDVVSGLNQISVATGQAAIASTAIHNALFS